MSGDSPSEKKKSKTKKKNKGKVTKESQKKRSSSATGPDGEELDGREAARALKKALAESADDSESEVVPAKRRRRPPTSMGVPAKRPKPPEEPKPPRDRSRDRPAFFQRHDLFVVVFGLALLVTGAGLARSLGQTTPRRFDRHGLRFHRPALFLPPQVLETSKGEPASDGTMLPYHVLYQSPADPLVRLEVMVDHRPTYPNLRAARALNRASRYGEMVWLKESDDIKISGRLWLRTEYRYAYKSGEFDSPEVATAIELATLNGALLYVVTVHGSEKAATELVNAIVGTLAVDANHPAAALIKE